MSSSPWVRHYSNKSDVYTPVVDKSISNRRNAWQELCWSFSLSALQPRGEARQRQEISRLVGNLRIPNKYRWIFTFSLSITTTLTSYTLFTYYIHGQVLVNNYGNVSASSCLNVKRPVTKHHRILMYIYSNITWHPSLSRGERNTNRKQRGFTIWFTGLSASGKSTIATALEQHLLHLGLAAYRLDGDNVRFGLNKDLGFSEKDRNENIRRIAEVWLHYSDLLCLGIPLLRHWERQARNTISPPAETIANRAFRSLSSSLTPQPSP